MTDKTTERQDLSVGPLFSEDALQRLRSELSFRMMMDPLIAACDAAIDWADANARWFDISTAPTKGMFLLWDNFNDDYEFGTAIQVAEDEYGRFTHWQPLPPPPSNPPLPEPLEALGAVLRKIKGA